VEVAAAAHDASVSANEAGHSPGFFY